MSQSSDKDKERKLKEAKTRVLGMAILYKRVFGSPEGQEVFKDICLNFEPNPICQTKDNNTTDIIVRAAYRDIIDHIERNIRVAEVNYNESERQSPRKS